MEEENKEDELTGIKRRLAEERAKLEEAVAFCPSIYEGGDGEEYEFRKQIRMLDYILTGEWSKPSNERRRSQS